MVAAKETQLDAYLRAPDPKIRCILIHGDDPVAVSERCRAVAARIAGSTADPFLVQKLECTSALATGGRLVEEAASPSMFGGTRVIWVSGSSEELAMPLSEVLDAPIEANLVLVESQMLPRKSRLKILLEESPSALVIPLYEADESTIRRLIESTLSRSNLRMDDDTKALLTTMVGTNRTLAAGEAEKLALYCMGASHIGEEEVRAVCDYGAEDDGYELVDAVFCGNLQRADRCFEATLAGGGSGGRVLSLLMTHVAQLQEIRFAIERGLSFEVAMKGLRPPLFFKRVPSMRHQSETWDSAALASAAATLAAAIAAGRMQSALQEALASRALLSVARQAAVRLGDRN